MYYVPEYKNFISGGRYFFVFTKIMGLTFWITLSYLAILLHFSSDKEGVFALACLQ